MADVHHKRCPKDMDPMWGQCACDVIDGLLADLRAKVSAQWVFGYDPDQVERIVGEAVLALIEEAGG